MGGRRNGQEYYFNQTRAQGKAMKHKFSVGDKVICIKDAGINWGEKTIVECVNNPVRGCTYRITPTDTPWFDDNEKNLFAPGDPAIEEKTVCYGHHTTYRES
jgi:hypothetical protein